MKAYVNIGANHEFRLTEAVLFIAVEAMAPSPACTKSSKQRMEFPTSAPARP